MGQRDLPLASGDRHVKAFAKAGWTTARHGNHYVLAKEGCPHALSIPCHKEVKRSLLQAQLRLAGISDEEYAGFFRGKRRAT